MNLRKVEMPVWLPIFLCIVLIISAVKIQQLRSDLSVTIEQTSKELTELRQAVAQANLRADEEAKAHRLMQNGWMDSVKGDGTETLLMDANHPYGQFVPAGVLPPPNYIPGPVWVINRRITPHTLDGTLNGVYAYKHPDGSLDGWYSTGGRKQ